MKTSSTSCSLLNSLRFSTAITVSKKSYYHYQATQLRNHNSLYPFPSFSSTFPRKYNFPGKCLHVNPFSAFSSSSGHDSQNPPRDLAVLLEVDGYPLLFFHYLIMRHCDKWFLIARIQKHACLLYIMHIIILLFLLTISVLQSVIFFLFSRVLVDAYRFGNRQAFNVGEGRYDNFTRTAFSWELYLYVCKFDLRFFFSCFVLNCQHFRSLDLTVLIGLRLSIQTF